MKRTARFFLRKLPLAVAGGVLLCSGCSHKLTDSQLAAKVQKQIAADSALQGQQIAVSANGGVVTLNGNASGPGSRELAGNDAAKVSGVKTVINNLGTGGSAMMNGQPIQSYSTTPPPSSGGQAGGQSYSNSNSNPRAYNQSQAMVIPAGTRIRVQLGQTLSTRNSQTGDPFSGTVVSPVQVNGQTLIPSGSPARGTVIDAKSQGRFKGGAVLAIRLDSVRANGRSYLVQTSRVERVEKGKGKRSLYMTGGGAGLGALIGALAGGGKGALIGGLVGGGGGAAGSAFTGSHDLVLPAEAVVTFVLDHSVMIR